MDKNKETKPVLLGSITKDQVTGYKGTVAVLIEWANGTKDAVIQGMTANENKEPPKPIETSIQNLQVLNNREAQETPPSLCPNFGCKMKHKLSGFEGTITGRALWLHGPERAYIYAEGVSPESLRPIGGAWFDVNELEVIGQGNLGSSQQRGGTSGTAGFGQPSAEKR